MKLSKYNIVSKTLRDEPLYEADSIGEWAEQDDKVVFYPVNSPEDWTVLWELKEQTDAIVWCFLNKAIKGFIKNGEEFHIAYDEANILPLLYDLYDFSDKLDDNEFMRRCNTEYEQNLLEFVSLPNSPVIMAIPFQE